MATFFDTQYCGRPCLLLLVWLLAIAGVMFLLFGMMLDDLTVGKITVSGGIDYKITCGSLTFDQEPGNLNGKYSEDQSEAVLQRQAGNVWLAFGILACLFGIPFTCIGVVTDYYAGIFDHRKPIECFKWCCMLQTWGFTSLGILFVIVFELLQIIAYAASARCSKIEFYQQVVNSTADDLKSTSGSGFVMVVFSLIYCLLIPAFILYYQYRISAELPTGEKKEAPVKIEMRPDGAPTTNRKKKEPTPPPAEPTGQAPDSAYFRPKNNVTSGYGDETEGNGSSSALKTKPSGPPPVPQPKPTGPPPVPNNIR